MSFLFKPPFVAAFRNLVSLQWTSSSSYLLLQHLGLSIFCDELPLQAMFCCSTLASRFCVFFYLLCFLSSLKLQLHFLLDFHFMFTLSYQTSWNHWRLFFLLKFSTYNLSSGLVKPWSSCAYKAYIWIYKWDGVLLFIWWHKN
jgi:hypothetical protein